MDTNGSRSVLLMLCIVIVGLIVMMSAIVYAFSKGVVVGVIAIAVCLSIIVAVCRWAF